MPKYESVSSLGLWVMVRSGAQDSVQLELRTLGDGPEIVSGLGPEPNYLSV
jgi:hypothetical protein